MSRATEDLLVSLGITAFFILIVGLLPFFFKVT
jgi:hypothetical protein